MKQEDKELLIKDLCARLPYGVKVQYRDIIDNIQYVETEFYEVCLAFPNNDYTVDIADVKPYLRPMSSMTEEEKKEYELLANRCITNSVGFVHFEAQELINWLIKNHFDYNGLIPKGLALEVTEINNPYEN